MKDPKELYSVFAVCDLGERQKMLDTKYPQRQSFKGHPGENWHGLACDLRSKKEVFDFLDYYFESFEDREKRIERNVRELKKKLKIAETTEEKFRLYEEIGAQYKTAGWDWRLAQKFKCEGYKIMIKNWIDNSEVEMKDFR